MRLIVSGMHHPKMQSVGRLRSPSVANSSCVVSVVRACVLQGRTAQVLISQSASHALHQAAARSCSPL
eukprot:36291-Pelagomonas_calceolata.AAC.1